MEYRARDISMVLWALKVHGAATTESVAFRLPQDLTVARAAEVLSEAEGRGLVRQLAGVWALTEAGHAHVRT
jgi:hypothetical protein